MAKAWRTAAAIWLGLWTPALGWAGESSVRGWRSLAERPQTMAASPQLADEPGLPPVLSPAAAKAAAQKAAAQKAAPPPAVKAPEPATAKQVATSNETTPARQTSGRRTAVQPASTATNRAYYQEPAVPPPVAPAESPAPKSVKPATPNTLADEPAQAKSGESSRLKPAFDGLSSEVPASSPAADNWSAYAEEQQPACCEDVCGVCCPARNYARVEYLMWWGLGRNIPPLATTGLDNAAREDAGVLGIQGTDVLYGDDRAGGDWRSGGRVTFGRVVGPTGDMSINGRFWGLEDSSETFASNSTGLPILARPFVDVNLGNSSLLLAYPGVSTDGSIRVQSKSDVFGADAYARDLWISEDNYTVEFIAGYQFTRIDDQLVIGSQHTSIDPLSATPVGTTFDLRDSFRTQNEFHGAQLGVATNWRRGRWNTELMFKLGVGKMFQTVEIAGRTITTQPMDNPITTQGALLARTNIGVYTRDELTYIPELGVTFAYELNPYWSLTAGYSFMYWNNVAFAGDQIDLTVNLTDPLVGDPRPQFIFRDADFWLQGLSFGVEARF